MTRIITRQPNPSLFQPDKRETKMLSSSQLSLRTHTLPCIWKEILAYQENSCSQLLGGMQWFSSCYSSSSGRSPFVFMFSAITQRLWWHFCIFNQSNDQTLRPWAHHLYSLSSLTVYSSLLPFTSLSCLHSLFSHILVIYSSQDALLSHLII